MKNLLEEIRNIHKEKVNNEIIEKWKCISVEDLKCKNDDIEYLNNGSFIYVAYNHNIVLYVGETGVHLGARFFGNGSGAHKNKEWFKNITSIRYFKISDVDPSENLRKRLECGLIFLLEPIHNNNS